MKTPFFPYLHDNDEGLALRVGDQRWSYQALHLACAQHLATLTEAGVEPGDRVGVWTHADATLPVILAAHLQFGVVSVPLNPKLGARELQHLLEDANPRVVFSTRAGEDALRTPGRRTLQARLDGPAATAGPGVPVDDEPGLLLYTSGTTGSPKGAVLTRRNLATTLDGLADAWGLGRADTIVHALPLFHAHGLVFGWMGALRAGACLHWLPRFEPAALGEALGEGRTVLYAVPTMYHRLALAAEQAPETCRGLRHARLLVSGSAALPAREHARIEALTGQRVVERYGLTETLINTAVRHDGERKAGYVGTPLPGVELNLVDDQRRVMNVHDDQTIGEVAVRGANVFPGYLNRPEATAEVLDARGWFYTGDLATRDADGYIRIVGRRATDLIKTGGFKVGAGEVEAALLEHPGVSEVAVLGLPDPDLGERIVACVVPTEDAGALDPDDLIAHAARLISVHKRPRQIHLRANLPRNAMGKVQKKRLRETLTLASDGTSEP